MRKRRMVRMPKRDGDKEGRIIYADSSSWIYANALVEADCRLIDQNRKMKEEEKIKSIKLNALKKGHPYESAQKVVRENYRGDCQSPK